MPKREPLEMMKDRKQDVELIEGIIKKQAVRQNELLHILEAGCGRRWPYNLEGVAYILTGVDLDSHALEARKNNEADLHEAIEGDLRTVDLPAASFDVIYCSYVLEHIKDADVVMANFVKWSKPNGIIILRIPDPDSVKGFFTRITPFGFHIFYSRFIIGNKNAGKPGFSPYPTYYHPVVSRSGMHNFCADETNNVELVAEYGDGYHRQGQGILRVLLHALKTLVQIISFGSLDARHTNLLYILRKRNA